MEEEVSLSGKAFGIPPRFTLLLWEVGPSQLVQAPVPDQYWAFPCSSFWVILGGVFSAAAVLVSAVATFVAAALTGSPSS